MQNIYYLSHPTDKERWQHMKQMFYNKLPRSIYPIRCLGPSAEKLGISPSQAGAIGMSSVFEKALLKEPFVPFLFLEDDVECTSFELFTYPPTADAIYVGISRCGLDSQALSHCDTVLRYRHPDYPHLFHIWNMLSTHAILILSKSYALAVLKATMEAASRNCAYDIILTQLSYRFEIYALASPCFYQSAKVKGQEEPTRIDWKDSINTVTPQDYAMWKNNPEQFKTKFLPPRTLVYSDWKVEPWEPVTVVSAYYEVRSKRSKKVYQEWGKNLLSLSCPLVIYTDSEENRLWMLHHRPSSLPTQIEVVPLSDLTSFGSLDFWTQQHRINPEKHHHSPQLYMVWHEKIKFVTRTIASNPFHSDKWVWCDFGYFREGPPPPLFPLADYIPEKKIMVLQVYPPSSLLSHDSIAAGLFAGTTQTLLEYEKIYIERFKQLLHSEPTSFLGKEQTIMNSIAQHHSEILEIQAQYGDWFYLGNYLGGNQAQSVVYLHAGLANRMKCIVSAWRNNPQTPIVWPISVHCNGSLVDLFCNSMQTMSVEQFFSSEKTIVWNSWRLLVKDTDPIPKQFSLEANALEAGAGENREIDFEYHRIPYPLQCIYINLFARFKVHPTIEKILFRVPPLDFGIQIRTWLDCPERKQKLWKPSNWIKVLQSQILAFYGEHKRQPLIYVTTDDNKCVKETILGKLPSSSRYRLLSLKSAEELTSTQKDLLEMYTLARASNLLVSRQSTFGEVAWYLGKCHAPVILV